MPGPTGYIFDPRERDRIQAIEEYKPFRVVAASLADSGRGKTRMLHEEVRKVLGRDLVGRQGIGDCVSWGCGKSLAHRIAVEVGLGTAKWQGEVSTESIYGLGRVEIGKRQLGNSDGMVGMWAVQAITKYGFLFRKPYGSIVDLTRYDARRAKEWGWTGLPDSLEPEADDQLVVDFALLRGWEDLRDAIWNGWPAFICSSWLPGDRDSQGFAKRDGSGGHCEAATGMTDEGSRPGALIDGSWGPFNGPKGKFDIPDSAYWSDAATIDKRIKEYGDSFCLKLMKASDTRSTDWSQI